jgi:uncharacterized PurR-regulated membrane protein YhhQ (DUF165 family)
MHNMSVSSKFGTTFMFFNAFYIFHPSHFPYSVSQNSIGLGTYIVKVFTNIILFYIYICCIEVVSKSCLLRKKNGVFK